mmetsp:Transcript_15658/g.18870  ORF Transcript_15658/g.18870 Transcript_15658/m.18870 type:complete len:301 (-) Transcript_15658:59-961(-)
MARFICFTAVVLPLIVTQARLHNSHVKARITPSVSFRSKFNYHRTSKPLLVRAENDFSDDFKKRVERMKDERASSLADDLNDSDKSSLPSADEIGVPAAQQPTKELENAKKNGLLFNWPSLPWPKYLLRIGTLYATIAALSFPFSQSGFDGRDLKAELITSNMVALGVLELLLLRLFVSWDYIGQRLVSEKVEYEQTGWYDGDVWEKPPQVVARDRLLHSSEVAPAMQRIQSSLLAFAVALFVSANSFNTVSKVEDPRATTRPSFLEQLKSPDQDTRDKAMEQAIKAAGDRPAWVQENRI